MQLDVASLDTVEGSGGACLPGFSQDRVPQRFVEQNIEYPVDQILDVPVPQMTEQLGEMPKMVSQERIQR